MLEIDKILKYNKSKISILFYKFICLNFSIFCILGFLFLVVEGINFDRNEVSVIRTIWADEINGIKNSDNITGTINQDTIRGFGGNDIISGLEGGDDISGGSGDDEMY